MTPTKVPVLKGTFLERKENCCPLQVRFGQDSLYMDGHNNTIFFFIRTALVSEGRGKGVSGLATKVYGAVEGQLHALPTSAVDGGEWSRPDHFTPRAQSPGSAN